MRPSASAPSTGCHLDATTARPAEYYEEQPFGQVPSYHDHAVSLFESGAIVLHIGRDCAALLPRDPAAGTRHGVAYRRAQQRRAVRDVARPAFKAALTAQIADFETREAVSA